MDYPRSSGSTASYSAPAHRAINRCQRPWRCRHAVPRTIAHHICCSGTGPISLLDSRYDRICNHRPSRWLCVERCSGLYAARLPPTGFREVTFGRVAYPGWKSECLACGSGCSGVAVPLVRAIRATIRHILRPGTGVLHMQEVYAVRTGTARLQESMTYGR